MAARHIFQFTAAEPTRFSARATKTAILCADNADGYGCESALPG
jgi:hypothetical protein